LTATKPLDRRYILVSKQSVRVAHRMRRRHEGRYAVSPGSVTCRIEIAHSRAACRQRILARRSGRAARGGPPPRSSRRDTRNSRTRAATVSSRSTSSRRARASRPCRSSGRASGHRERRLRACSPTSSIAFPATGRKCAFSCVAMATAARRKSWICCANRRATSGLSPQQDARRARGTPARPLCNRARHVMRPCATNSLLSRQLQARRRSRENRAPRHRRACLVTCHFLHKVARWMPGQSSTAPKRVAVEWALLEVGASRLSPCPHLSEARSLSPLPMLARWNFDDRRQKPGQSQLYAHGNRGEGENEDAQQRSIFERAEAG
jgi:hypothetical protein